MWEVTGKPVSAERFRPFEPAEVLYDFDGPRTFTLRDGDDELYLAHWLDEDREAARFVVVPFTDRLLDKLKTGEISVRDALDQPRVFTVDVGADATVRGAWRVELSSLPTDALPRPTTMLWPSLEPIASVRALGERVRVGAIPHTVVRAVADSLPRAYRTLLDYSLGTIPEEVAQKIKARDYEPLAQRVCLASFEISFRMPELPTGLFDALDDSTRKLLEGAIRRSGELLRTGLRWATSDNATSAQLRQLTGSEDETRALLVAIENLMPAGRGPIQAVELRGAWVGATTRPLKLTRENRRAVAGALREMPIREPHRLNLTGRIRELDKDRLSFELRDIVEREQPSRRFLFDDSLLDDVEEAFEGEEFVRVTGLHGSANRPGFAVEITRVNV
jgi:hypothetical protein